MAMTATMPRPLSSSSITNPLLSSTAQMPTMGSMSYSDSPLTQLPNVDFHFDDLRKRMAEFTVKFDAFIERGRKRVLVERNEFRGRLGEINEDQKSTSTQIATLQTSLSQHATLQTREIAEKSEMQSQISELETHHANHLATRDRLKTSLQQTQRQIESKLTAQREYAVRMDGQSRLNGPELGFWETYLGCRIEGSGEEDVVRVVFVFPGNGKKGDLKDGLPLGAGEKEAVFELKIPDTSSKGYEIVHCRPKLDHDKIGKVLTKLNETREIGTLLKGMRELFGEVMR